VPSYVRTELKKKTGILINEFGEKIEEENEDKEMNFQNNPNEYVLKKENNQKSKLPKKEYTPINSYKPSGNLIYDDNLLNKIENKFR
jgi:hypothetical protein